MAEPEVQTELLVLTGLVHIDRECPRCLRAWALRGTTQWKKRCKLFREEHYHAFCCCGWQSPCFTIAWEPIR